MDDDLGHRVTVERAPRRIISLAPNTTEMLFALGLGERVVGVSDFCNYPPEAKRKPRVGGYVRPSVERILSLQPDLVVASRGNPPETLRQLDRTGVAVYAADPQTIDQVIALVRRLGRLTGRSEAGRALALDLERRVRKVRAETAAIPDDRRPLVLLVISDEPLFVAGSGTFLDDLIRAAGGRNAAGAYRGFAKPSREAMASLKWDVILTTLSRRDDVLRIKLPSELTRGPANRVLPIHRLDEDIVSRPGPRVADALEKIHAILSEAR